MSTPSTVDPASVSTLVKLETGGDFEVAGWGSECALPFLSPAPPPSRERGTRGSLAAPPQAPGCSSAEGKDGMDRRLS